VPHPTDHAIHEQHRVVAGLARRGEPAGRGCAWVQPLPRLTGDDEGVEVPQQADPSMRLGRRPGVAGKGPARRTVQLDVLQLVSQLVEQLDGAPRRDTEPSGEVLGRGWAVGVQVAHDQGPQGRLAVVGPEAGQPAVRVGVGHLAAPVWSEAEHAAVGGRARELAPARPPAPERLHRLLAGPRAGTVHDRLGQLVDGQLGVRQGVADGGDDLLSLVGAEADRLGMGRHRRWQGRQRPRPHRQVGGRQQVHGPARAERLDQGAVLPEGTLDVSAGRPGDAPPDRELGGAEDLGVGAAQHPGDVGRAQVRSRFGQRVAGHPPGRDAAPAQRGRVRGRGGHGPHPLAM
jgi:hypothetical protein